MSTVAVTVYAGRARSGAAWAVLGARANGPATRAAAVIQVVMRCMAIFRMAVFRDRDGPGPDLRRIVGPGPSRRDTA